MDWTDLIIEAPLLVAFIWFALQMNQKLAEAQNQMNLRLAEAQKAFLDSLCNRDDRFDRRNEAVIQAILTNTKLLAELAHDLAVHESSTARLISEVHMALRIPNGKEETKHG